MKIRCKSCKKRFDTAIYSGLCPRCGTYHRIETEDSLALQQGKSEPAGEEAHKLLHETYDGLGKEYVRWHDGVETEEKRENPKKWENPKKREKKEPGRAVLAFRILVIGLIFLLPAISFFSYQIWKLNFQESRMLQGRAIGEKKPVEKTLVFDGSEMEYPTTVTVEGAGEAACRLLPEGMKFWLVKARTVCEGYSYDTAVRGIYLFYQDGAECFYQEPLNTYDVRGYLPELGLTEEALLSDYAVGGGSAEEGYWIFLVEESVGHPELVLTVEDQKEPEEVLYLGRIALDDFTEDSLSLERKGQE